MAAKDNVKPAFFIYLNAQNVCLNKNRISKVTQIDETTIAQEKIISIQEMECVAGEVKRFVNFQSIVQSITILNIMGQATSKFVCVDCETKAHAIEFNVREPPQNIQERDVVKVMNAILKKNDFGISLSDSCFTSVKFVKSTEEELSSDLHNISKQSNIIFSIDWEDVRTNKPNSLVRIDGKIFIVKLMDFNK
jgi:hypothetical protein